MTTVSNRAFQRSCFVVGQPHFIRTDVLNILSEHTVFIVCLVRQMTLGNLLRPNTSAA